MEGNSAGEVYSFAVTKYHMQGALNNRNLFPPSSEGYSWRSRGQQGWFLRRPLSLAYRLPSSLRPFQGLPLESCGTETHPCSPSPPSLCFLSLGSCPGFHSIQLHPGEPREPTPIPHLTQTQAHAWILACSLDKSNNFPSPCMGWGLGRQQKAGFNYFILGEFIKGMM